MNIVLTRSMLPEDMQYIKDGLDKEIKGQYVWIVPKTFTEADILSAASKADVLLGPYVTPGILQAAKHLKLIQVPWTGMDTFDFNAVRNCSVPVCNTHSNADAVAELGVTLTLDLLKKVSYHDRKMRVGNWNRDQTPLSLKSKMLCEQTVCILGFGNIGSRIGRLVAAFGACVIAVDQQVRDDAIAKKIYPDHQLKEAVAAADVIICTLPLTSSTRGIINANVFDVAKPGAIFVNISRAAVVDEDALWTALQNGRLGAFGSDVWWNSPKRGECYSYPSTKHAFWELDNVLISPHRAGFVEGVLPHLDGAVKNIIALVQGKALSDIVDVKREF